MARISDAQKIDVLREIVLEDYNAQIDFKMSADGSGSININITDPRTREREEIRTWIEQNLESEDDSFARMNLLTMLDERDKKSQLTWGPEKGKPLPYSVTIWFDDKIADVLENFFSSEELRTSVRETIRTSLKSDTDTKGF